MKRGDRIETEAGPGEVTNVEPGDDRYYRPNAWVTVRLDDGTHRTFMASALLEHNRKERDE